MIGGGCTAGMRGIAASSATCGHVGTSPEFQSIHLRGLRQARASFFPRFLKIHNQLWFRWTWKALGPISASGFRAAGLTAFPPRLTLLTKTALQVEKKLQTQRKMDVCTVGVDALFSQPPRP